MKKSKSKKSIENKFCLQINCECSAKPILDNLFPYYKPECLTEDEFDILKDNLIDKKDLLEDNKEHILKVYNRVFKQNREYGEKVYNHIERVYKEFI